MVKPKREFLHFDNSDKLCEYVAEQTGGVALLSFSGGKDSVAAWLQMRKFFDRIVPVFGYLIPDLECVERGLTYYEEFFRTPIIRMPHPRLWEWWYDLMYQPPANLRPLYLRGDFRYSWDDLFEAVKYTAKLSDNTHTALGVRMADSQNRRTSIMRYGAVNQDRRTFFPNYDWNKAQVTSALVTSGVRLSPEYLVFGRSFDGLDYRFLAPLRDYYPKDYERVREMFPLVDAAFLRHDQMEAHYG